MLMSFLLARADFTLDLQCRLDRGTKYNLHTSVKFKKGKVGFRRYLFGYE